MTDRKVLIGDIANGVVLHQQGQWSTGNDRLIDPEGRVLALLEEIGAPVDNVSNPRGSVNTVYVDAERDEGDYIAVGTFDRPFTLLQDGIEALMALPVVDGGNEVNGVLRIAPSRKYLTQTGQLIMTLPSDSAVARRLALVADSVGASNAVILPPMRIDSPSNASINFIAMRGLSFAGVSGDGADMRYRRHVERFGQTINQTIFAEPDQLTVDVVMAIAGLSGRERIVCQGLAEGLSLSQIASQMNCGWHTVKRIKVRLRQRFEEIGLEGWVRE